MSQSSASCALRLALRLSFHDTGGLHHYVIRAGRAQGVQWTGEHVPNLIHDRNFGRVEILVKIMIKEFGGVAGFVAAWGDHCRRSMESGGFAALRCFKSVLRLIEFCDANRPSASALDDEQLADELLSVTLRTIQDRPELAVEILQQAGWRVSPPEPTLDD